MMNILKCMLGSCKQIFEKYLSRSFAHFKMCSLCILDINPLWNSGFINFFSHPVGFHLFSFLYRYFLAWCSYSCLVFLCSSVLFCRIYNGGWGTGLYFLLEALWFGFLPVDGISKDPKSVLLNVGVHFSSRHFLGRSFTMCWLLFKDHLTV